MLHLLINEQKIRWVYGYDVQTKSQSLQWEGEDGYDILLNRKASFHIARQ